MKIDITPIIPPLPEGWVGNPDDLLDWIEANATFEMDGDFPSGQVGGSKPTESAGIYYGEHAIEMFRDGEGAYRPITDVPIGAMLPWASALLSPPEWYLFADGAEVLRADYPFLFNVIGTTWGTPSGSTVFKLPDMQGRVIYGSGTGDYADQGITGKLEPRVTGQKIGTSWLRRVGIYLNAPVASMVKVLAASTEQPATINWNDTTQPGLVMPWIIRYK